MGNAIKNYERKKRREQNKKQREYRDSMHNALMKECGFPRTFKEKEKEIYNCIYISN